MENSTYRHEASNPAVINPYGAPGYPLHIQQVPNVAYIQPPPPYDSVDGTCGPTIQPPPYSPRQVIFVSAQPVTPPCPRTFFFVIGIIFFFLVMAIIARMFNMMFHSRR